LDGDRIIFDSHGERGHVLSVVDVTTGEVNALDVPGHTLYRPLAVKGQDKVLVHEDLDGRAVLHLLYLPCGELSRVAEGVSVTDSWPAPNGAGVYYLQYPDGGEEAGFIEYRDLEGGDPRRVLDRRVACFGIADDEQTFGICSKSESGDDRFEIFSLVDGSSRDVTDLFENVRWMSFARGSTALTYSLDGTPGVWLEVEEGAEPRRIAPFGKSFAWSPDGERLAVIRQGVRDNVVLIRDFDPRVTRSP
jgi:hypothetical protein